MRKHPVLANSIAKAGTYLLTRTIILLGRTQHPVTLHGAVTARSLQVEETRECALVGVDWPCLVPQQKLRNVLASVSGNQFINGHLPYSSRTRMMIENLGFIMPIIVRDPRDIVISHVNWVLSQDYIPYHQYYHSLQPDDRLMAAIHGFSFKPHGPLVLPLQRRFQMILDWQRYPLAYLIKYEHLVGEKGGGSIEKQKAAIRDIAIQLGVDADDENITQVASHVYGGTFTFKGGKISKWRHHFKQAHIDAIKEEVGDYIVELGYEPDQSWGLND